MDGKIWKLNNDKRSPPPPLPPNAGDRFLSRKVSIELLSPVEVEQDMHACGAIMFDNTGANFSV